jgi:MraZ protein
MKREEMGLIIGSFSAKLDKSGRLKIPQKYRAAIEEQYGKDLFITSFEDECIQIFPFQVWNEVTGASEKTKSFIHPNFQSFYRHAYSKGTPGEIDTKGRVLINQELREKAGLQAEVKVIGLNNYLEVWDKNRLKEQLEKKPLTFKDYEKVAELMSDGKPK